MILPRILDTTEFVSSEPQNVVTADEDLPQIATKASLDPLLGEPGHHQQFYGISEKPWDLTWEKTHWLFIVVLTNKVKGLYNQQY